MNGDKPSIFAELKRRNVIRVAGLYLVGAWLLIQVASTVLPTFEVPGWALRGLIITLALGFVPALIFSWVFELTPQGLKRDDEVKPEESIAPQTARRMNRMIIGVLVLALGYFVFDKFVLTPKREAVKSHTAPMPNEPQSTVNAKSIAVLPFVNMSSDKEQDYFSDGLSEELLNQLAQIPQLRVIARTSSFSFKGKEVDVATIAKALSVANVLEGSVRKSANTLRITAQLVRASDSSHLWSQTYDRQMTDVFKVQEEIASEVVAALKLKLLPAQQLPKGQRTRNVDAYEQYLLGVELSRANKRDSVQRSVAALQKAIALDPQYANAYATLAYSQRELAESVSDPAQRSEIYKQAFASVEKAIALAPDMARGYGIRAYLRYRYLWDWVGAEADYERAIALDPGDTVFPSGITGYAHFLFWNGRQAQALALDVQAVGLDPLSGEAVAAYGLHLLASGQIAEGRQALQRGLELDANLGFANYNLGYSDLKEGKLESAQAHFRMSGDGYSQAGRAMVEFTLGNEDASQQALAELERDFVAGYAYQLAQVYAWRGEKDKAFEWLDRSYVQHDAGMTTLRYDPILVSLHDDPRFAALVKKMGFAE